MPATGLGSKARKTVRIPESFSSSEEVAIDMHSCMSIPQSSYRHAQFAMIAVHNYYPFELRVSNDFPLLFLLLVICAFSFIDL